MSESPTPPFQAETASAPVPGPHLPVTPGALFNLRLPADAHLSSDGKRAAFVVEGWVGDEPKPRVHVWVVETSGGDPRPFIRNLRESFCPRWSPDSRQLAFIGKVDGEGSRGKPQLYLISVDSGATKQVCVMPNGVSDLEWSPDGSRIAFISLEGEEPTNDPRLVAPGRHRRLWTVRPDSDIPEPVTPDGVTVWEHAWSPDSRQFALYYSTGPEEADWFRGQIGLVPACGGAVRQLTQLTHQASAITWAPDGTRLAYISGEWSDPGRGAGDVFILPVEDGPARNLTPNAECSPSWCRWFPDGHRLLYVAWKGVTHQIGTLDEITGAMTPLVNDFVMEGYFWPHLSTTPDARSFATIHSSPLIPPDVWFGELTCDGGTPDEVTWRRLSRMNPIVEETLAFAFSERIRYESGDGCRIDAILTHPLVRKSDAPPPLLVYVHGGPSWAWCDGFSIFWTQMLASAGYAVLRPNVRGSWGRGVAFADAVIGDMGGRDFQDILNGVEDLVERGLADSQRVGIIGWSYGGFMAGWAVTQTTRFKAAVIGAGISDWHNFHAQSSLRTWDVRFLAADPLEFPEVYREHSPITYAARVETPTLILHGENDEAVPLAQAYALYHALHERDIPVEFVVYPREGHGPNELAHLRDMESRVLRWIERYV